MACGIDAIDYGVIVVHLLFSDKDWFKTQSEVHQNFDGWPNTNQKKIRFKTHVLVKREGILDNELSWQFSQWIFK
jgi:hypothetical protein